MEESEFSSGETRVKVLRLGGVHQTKKDPRGAHTSEIPSSRSDATSPSSWSLVMRSGRTVRRGSGDRSWFGRPQAIKKAAGNAARKKGTNASKVLDSPAAPPSSGSRRCRGRRLRTAKKKGGSLIPPRTTHRPLTEGNESKMTEEIPTGRRRHDKKSLV